MASASMALPSAGAQAPGSPLPPPPPDVTQQMGGDPMQAAAKAGLGAGGANPAGAFLAKGELLDKVLKQMATDMPKFGPYGDRASQIIKAGMAEAAGGMPQSSAGIMAPGSQAGAPSYRPPSGGPAGMPG